MKTLKHIFICIGTCWLLIGAGSVAAEEEGGSSTNYYALKPAFVANFGTGQTKKLKFLKAEITVRASSGVAINNVMNNDALVRHEIVMLLSKQTEESLTSSKGQETVRKAALEVVQAALKEETGDEQINDLLFTSFVVQR